jgi:hypothetical protein
MAARQKGSSVNDVPRAVVTGRRVAMVGLIVAMVLAVMDRRDVRRWTVEIVEWQHKLGLLIFCAHDGPVRQEHE